jgi:hypothetical protein
MQVRIHPAVTVLYSTHKTTLKELPQLSNVSKEVYTDAANNSFVSGPVYWIYHGAEIPKQSLRSRLPCPSRDFSTHRNFPSKSWRPLKQWCTVMRVHGKSSAKAMDKLCSTWNRTGSR